MLYQVRPLQLSLEFESRAYKLGGTIEVVVEMRPSTNIQVRGGRVDLVCEERYNQRGSFFHTRHLRGHDSLWQNEPRSPRTQGAIRAQYRPVHGGGPPLRRSHDEPESNPACGNRPATPSQRSYSSGT